MAMPIVNQNQVAVAPAAVEWGEVVTVIKNGIDVAAPIIASNVLEPLKAAAAATSPCISREPLNAVVTVGCEQVTKIAKERLKASVDVHCANPEESSIRLRNWLNQ